jgi:ATP-binding cassette, subfamily B, bacterial
MTIHATIERPDIGARPALALGAASLGDFLRQMAPLFAARRGVLLRVAGLSCVASLLALAQPWLAMVLVDDGALGGNLRVLAAACVMMLVAPLIGLALEAVTRFDYLALSTHVLFGLRERVFAHLQTLSPTYYARVGFGDLVARFDGDLAEVQRFAVDGPLALLNGVFNLLALLVLLSVLSPLLAVVALAAVPLQLAVTLHQRPRIEANTVELRRQSTLLSAFFLDSLRAVKFIQASNAEAARLAGLRDRHGEYYAALRAAQQSGFALGAWQRMAGLAGTVLVFGVGGYLLAARQISVGVLVAFIIYAARAGAPVQTLLGVFSGWQRARVSLHRLGELLADPVPGPARTCRPMPLPIRGELTLEGVSFAYRPGEPVLQDADLHVPAGSKVLLVGPSGGGKSTLSDLILGHLRPETGQLRLDGVDLAAIDLAELRRHVAVVDQEPVFFPGSVADNLRFIAPTASDATLRAVLLDAGLAAGEVGLDTSVGAASAALSRGQRMRLALARALLQRPAVLILDETTTAVDRAMEQQLLATVDERFVGCTRLLITHHPRAAPDADAAYQLRQGRFLALTAEALADAG